MSKSARGTIVPKQKSELPGPGQYDDTNCFGSDVQSFAFRGKG